MQTNQRSDGDQWTITSSVGRTALLVALGRAIESRRADALIDDPFAEALVVAAGEDDLAPDAVAHRAQDDPTMSRSLEFLADMMAARTLRIDEEIRAANAGRCRQLVLLASGLDARAARIEWAPGTTVFEVDQPAVIGFKDEVLDAVGARPSATRVSVACDLRDDWLSALRGSGLADDVPTFWLAEGLLPYLRPADQERLLSTITSVAPSGSVVMLDTTSGPITPADFDVDASGFGVSVEDLFLDTGEFDAQAWLADNGWTASSESVVSVLGEHGRGTGITSDAQYSAMIGKVRIVTAHRD
ncbi:SAM-dependent methyltransferase [Williamsia deligens]|uniref:S-adenosyl-L-methionine-dependent methyltransferase n=1 Tax=Williamsia deligens TaxID=321325 RepID=A0ABW3G912_9NOCA|nr:SAM-dependent methyltransferase [Williamsia deligens]MCP2193864.1 methyltransferase, TIGR00027 family [Williamsia deligens]